MEQDLRISAKGSLFAEGRFFFEIPFLFDDEFDLQKHETCAILQQFQLF